MGEKLRIARSVAGRVEMKLNESLPDYDNGVAPEGSFGEVEAVRTPVEPDASGKEGRRSKVNLRNALLVGLPFAALLIGTLVYLHSGRYQSTDNAYVQSGMTAVSSSVSGRVIAVDVQDNQHVRTGQVLFRIDPAPFRTAVAAADAALADARTQIGSLQAKYGQGVAEFQAAHYQLDYATREAARQKALLAEGISSQAQYDQARLAEKNARADIVIAQKKNDAVRAALAGAVDGPIDQQPSVRRAQAALDQARLDLGYTVVRAHQDGIATKVDQLQIGNYVSAAKPVFTLVGNQIWVEANFKENQLDHMRVGQRATVKVDAFPSLKLTARIATFSPGTGNSFALLPAENATGNWVKVVQRLPVELALDRVPADLPLHAGLSVEATVDTGFKHRLFERAAPTTR